MKKIIGGGEELSYNQENTHQLITIMRGGREGEREGRRGRGRGRGRRRRGRRLRT